MGKHWARPCSDRRLSLPDSIFGPRWGEFGRERLRTPSRHGPVCRVSNGVKRHSAESCVIVTPGTDANYQVTFNAVPSAAVVV
jgi:hypothetical protein